MGNIITNTLRRDTVRKPEEALIEIYRKLRPGDPPTLDTASALFEGMFFDQRKYDFSRVGRLKFNIKLYENQDASGLDKRTLTPEDFYGTIRYLLKLRKNIGMVDDIDHLGNRRVRAVGELMENQFRIGLVRMERAIKEKMSVYQEMSTAMPHDLINAKPVMAAIREFFGSSQLSQFMDQTNPLSEITHKRRLSALGPGGLSRERAGFEVRDVHPTHYGRICPIETPEGPNIGLISSLSCFARINEYGFIESPYRRVKDGRVLDFFAVVNAGESSLRQGDHIEANELRRLNERLRKEKKRQVEVEPYSFYLSAWEEDRHTVAQANIELDEKGNIVQNIVDARRQGNFVMVNKPEVDYVDVSPKQLVSVAASLVPFLEHDDANRALMGANMQRQSVPLLVSEAPYVGTGMEGVTARDSGAVILAKRNGIVDSVDSERIIVRVEGEHHPTQLSREVGSDIYQLTKFKRSNQNTCINQKPIVSQGDRVRQGAGDRRRAMHGAGRAWPGTQRSGGVHAVARIQLRGRDPDQRKAGEGRLLHLHPHRGVRDRGARHQAGAGGDHARHSQRQRARAARPGRFGDHPHRRQRRAQRHSGGQGDAQGRDPVDAGREAAARHLRREGGRRARRIADLPSGHRGDDRGRAHLQPQGTGEGRARQADRAGADREAGAQPGRRDPHSDRRAAEAAGRDSGRARGAQRPARRAHQQEAAQQGRHSRPRHHRADFSTRNLKRIRYADKDPRVNEQIDEIEEMTSRQIDVLRKITNDKVGKMQKGDELSPGVIKMVKVYVAMKRKLSVGDKMAGRHGNKGVIARILPEEDMPYLPDGTPVEIVLNPLGVPSRMNVGQILETHLGWAAHELGKQIAEAAAEMQSASEVRELFKARFAGTAALSQLLDLDDAQTIRAASGMKRGIWFATAVFDGARETEIKALLKAAGLPSSGKTQLYDGMVGEPFEQPATVGYIYMLKLSHLVDDKIHARSIGPYSLITQQPLGGKAQFGGQRFGEMEVWALEAYGAAYILQELLTAKSDDVFGRTKIYEAIVKGEAAIEPGVPESFNVLIRELQSLCLDVELIKQIDQKKVPLPELALAD